MPNNVLVKNTNTFSDMLNMYLEVAFNFAIHIAFLQFHFNVGQGNDRFRRKE